MDTEGNIEVVELDTDRDDHIEALMQTRNATDPEINPDDPQIGSDELRAQSSRRTARTRMRTWIAFFDGDPAGDIAYELEDDEENRHVASTEWFAVDPGLRRNGVADALLGASLPALAAEGRTSLLLWGPRIEPDVAAAYVARLGLEQRTEERCSRVRSADIPDDLIDDWLARGRARDDGYRLVQFGGRCPEHLVVALLGAAAAMQDAPVDDLDWKPPRLDESELRAREDAYEHEHFIVARSLVVAPDGSGAGLSDLFVNGFRPELAWQGDTGVVAAHRGRGLGRWLKAENLRHAQRLAPDFRVIETYNAQSNPWMLDINVAMGFRPHVIWRGFQGSLISALDIVS
ncbi:MAG: GNAT family N-acetyltransferase [Acidimicrobiales bacterium]